MNFEYWRHSTRAWLFHFVGQDARAFTEYAAAFKLAPSARAAAHLGFIACQSNRHGEGAEWFAEATRIDPGNADTWFNLGFAHEQAHRPEAAILAFTEAIRLKPALDRAWYGLALANAVLGKHGEAAQALEETVRMQPMHGEAWYHLGMAHHFTDQVVRLEQVIVRLRSFEPKRANQLIQDSGRRELTHLLTELPF